MSLWNVRIDHDWADGDHRADKYKYEWIWEVKMSSSPIGMTQIVGRYVRTTSTYGWHAKFPSLNLLRSGRSSGGCEGS